MKLRFDALPTEKRNAERQVNDHFARLSSQIPHAAHRAKREAAALVLNGGDAPDWFQRAAEIERLTPHALAHALTGKPDESVELDNRRREMIVAIRNAASSAQLDAVMEPIKGAARL